MTYDCLKIFGIVSLLVFLGSCDKKRAATSDSLKGLYIGFEEMCTVDSATGKKSCYMNSNPKEKWYYESRLELTGDSVLLYQSPVSIAGKDTVYSASDGGFYYYRGIIQHKNKSVIIKLIEYARDYCGELMKRNLNGTYTRIFRKKIFKGYINESNELVLNGIVFIKLTKSKDANKVIPVNQKK